MKIHQIRSATLIITYHGKRFLIDPWLMPKDYMPGFEAAVNPEVRQPRCELPLPIDTIVDTDAVILTHYHPDHWDDFAAGAIRKDMPFFVQSGTDCDIIRSLGFTDVRILSEAGTSFEGILLCKTGGQHGKREIVKALFAQAGFPYDTMGVVFRATDEKTLYLAGDTIWCDEARSAIDRFSPDVIIVNACGAMLPNGERIIMDAADVETVCAYAPSALIIASHMDNVSHLTVTRDDLKKLNLPNLAVPDDNEILDIPS